MTTTVAAGPFVDWLRRELETCEDVGTLRDRLGLGGGSLRALLETDPLEQLPLERVDRYLTRADGAESSRRSTPPNRAALIAAGPTCATSRP